MNIGLNLRPATRDDLNAVAHLHVKSWQQTYAGHLPPDILDSAEAEESLKMWQEHFGKDRSGLLLACMGERIIGFVAYGPARDAEAKGWGEIYAIHLLREAWKRGVGFAMFKKAKQGLLQAGFPKVYLWVLDSNKQAIEACQRWGGTVDLEAKKEDEVVGCTIREVLVQFDGSAVDSQKRPRQSG